MRSPLHHVVPLALVVALTGTVRAQTALPGIDIRSYLTADISTKLSLAGTWMPTGTSVGTVGPFWNVIKLGASQREGVALGGWVFNGSFNSTLTAVTPVRPALLEQQANGTLLVATASLLGDAITNGAGSVIVADFNGDGLDDLVFPAHNESPFIWAHSTAWISRPGGEFDKLTLTDNVMNHDARLVTIDGKKKILAYSFGGSGNQGNGPGFHVLYSWIGNTFTVDTNFPDLGGMSVNAGPFTGNADNWLIVGDTRHAYGLPSLPTSPMQNYAYKFNAGVVTFPAVSLPKPYFNDKPAYAGYVSFWDPHSKSHTSRLWTTDLNQDGLPDILAGTEIWTQGPVGLQKAVFQLLINRGNMVFTDETDALAPEFSQDSVIDYSVRFADVDGSGIETMFLSSPLVNDPSADPLKQGQYILVNDGTGRLHAAMHDEFRAMRTQIQDAVNRFMPEGRPYGPPADYRTPQFIAYRTDSGALNFLAVVHYFVSAEPLPRTARYAFINVPLGINLTTDFRRDLTIATRNGSKRIRTFAGDDTIYRAVSDPDCTIDGGLGSNTVVYPGKLADWVMARAGDVVTVRPAFGPGGTDSLTNIQAARFDDQVVKLAAVPPPQAAATVVEYFNAALDHYFISHVPDEIGKLDAGTAIKGWARTGKSFATYPAAQAGTTPVCRYYIPPGKGDSHFFGRGTAECDATGQKNPSFVLEDPQFMQMYLPTAGNCPVNTTQVYRVYSNRADANHRYMTDRSVRDQMVAKGWLAEGDGPDLVVMCAPK